MFYIFKNYLKPTLNKITGKDQEKTEEEKEKEKEQIALEKSQQEADDEDGAIVELEGGVDAQGRKQLSSYEINMDMAKQLAASDPKIVANVIKTWVSNE